MNNRRSEGDIRMVTGNIASTGDNGKSIIQRTQFSGQIEVDKTDNELHGGEKSNTDERIRHAAPVKQQKRRTTDVQQPLAKFRKRSSGFSHVNVRDPLNLSSVKPDNPNDPDFAKPIAVIVTNVNDPLNLQNLPSAASNSKERKRKRGKQTREDSDEAKNTEDETETGRLGLRSPTFARKRRFIMGPIEKESKKMSKEEETMTEKTPNDEKKTEEEMTASTSDKIEDEGTKQRRERSHLMAERYRYGNFNHYQLKRLPSSPIMQGCADLQLQEDPRVQFFCPDWFHDKTVLDVGCNAGHFAICLARAYQPRRVVGIDLDQHLVGAARKNIRHFCDKDTKIVGKFPASFGANFGPISAPSTAVGPYFPDNIWFFCENYVLSTDAELEKVREEFDIIFTLACTKWVHLNWGDLGIKRFFHRVFRQLRTGGRFVLETAPFKEYRKHCNKKGPNRPPEEVIRHFEAIHFYPDDFTGFLLSNVGFSHHEELDNPHSKSLGISGRLQVFYKGMFFQRNDGVEGRTNL